MDNLRSKLLGMSLITESVRVGLMLLFTFLLVQPCQARPSEVTAPGVGIPPIVYDLQFLQYGIWPWEKDKPIKFMLVYSPRNVTSEPVSIDVTVSTYGDIAISLPILSWTKEFSKPGAREPVVLDSVEFTVTPADNDTTGFYIALRIGDYTRVEPFTLVTATKNLYVATHDPKAIIVPPHAYFESRELYWEEMARIIREAKQHPLDDSMQAAAKEASKAFEPSVMTHLEPVKREGADRKPTSMRFGYSHSEKSPFLVIQRNDQLYIRFQGESEFALLGSAASSHTENSDDRSIVFLKLTTRTDLLTAAKLIPDLNPHPVSGNYPDQILGTYRATINPDIVQALQEAGIELITNNEYHLLLHDYSPPPDSAE